MTRPSDEELARVAKRQHGIFALSDLAELEFSKTARDVRITSGRWELLYDGVYRIAGSPSTWHGGLLAACWAGGTRAVASHRSAAALWSLPSGSKDGVELTCPRWRRARHPKLVVHETTLITDVDRTVVAHIPCTTAARTLFDLARFVSPVMLEANLDSAVRRDLVTITELEETAGRLATQGRPGGRRFREIVSGRTDDGAIAESVPERRLADLLVRQGLPAPVLQHEVRDGDGRFVARVDLAYPALMLAIEYDSFEHHLGKLAHVRDSTRRNALTDLGYTVLTATAHDVRDGARRLSASVRGIRDRAAA